MKKRGSRRRRSSGGGGRARRAARGALGGVTRVLKSGWTQKALMGIGAGTVGGMIGNAVGGNQGAAIGRAGGAFLTGGLVGVAADQVLAYATGQPSWITMLMGGLGGNGNGGGGSL